MDGPPTRSSSNQGGGRDGSHTREEDEGGIDLRGESRRRQQRPTASKDSSLDQGGTTGVRQRTHPTHSPPSSIPPCSSKPYSVTSNEQDPPSFSTPEQRSQTEYTESPSWSPSNPPIMTAAKTAAAAYAARASSKKTPTSGDVPAHRTSPADKDRQQSQHRKRKQQQQYQQHQQQQEKQQQRQQNPQQQQQQGQEHSEEKDTYGKLQDVRWFLTNNQPSLEAHKVPIEMRESYIVTGYRPPSIGVTVSAWSAFYLHNETLNFWTHMIPFIYFFYFLFIDQGPWLRLTLISPLGRYPFYGFMVGICTLFGASSFAHLFHCAGQRRWRNVCFVMDYAAISVYGTASAIAYYFYSRPRFRGTFIGYMLSGEGHFLGFTTATAWVATYASCMTRLRPTPFCYAIRTAAFALPFLTGSFPAIMRWISAGAHLEGPPAVVFTSGSTSPAPGGATGSGSATINVSGSSVMDARMGTYEFPQLDYDFQTPYTRHLVMLAVGSIINVIKVPERFWPGRFDTIGSSHQWFHILVFFSIREQFWLMLEEIACHSGMLYSRDPDSSMPWGRATIKPSQSDGAMCTIITSTTSSPQPPPTLWPYTSSGSSTSWFYPWGWSWNSLLFCALGNPRSNLDTWMALNTIAWMTILLSVLTITIVWFGYSYNFEFTPSSCCGSPTREGSPATSESSHATGFCHSPSSNSPMEEGGRQHGWSPTLHHRSGQQVMGQ